MTKLMTKFVIVALAACCISHILAQIAVVGKALRIAVIVAAILNN